VETEEARAVKRQYVEAGAARGSRGRTNGLHHHYHGSRGGGGSAAEEAMLPPNEGRASAPANKTNKKTNSTSTSMTLWIPLLTFTPV
jgi:hypothetical protein